MIKSFVYLPAKSTSSAKNTKEKRSKSKSRHSKIIIIEDLPESVSSDESSEKEPELDYESIPGVKIVVFGTKSQNRFNLKVCDDVTEEKPWRFVDRETLVENFKDNTDLVSIRKDIENFTGDAMLFGYANVEDEQPDYNNFYFCSTIEAQQEVEKAYKNLSEIRQRNLLKSIYKYPRPWMSLGSEVEVDDMDETKCYRPLFEIEIDSRFPVYDENTCFENRGPDDVIDGFVEIVPTRETFDNTVCKRVSIGVQAAPPRVPGTVQTTCTFPTNQWTQYEYEYEVPREAPIIVKKGQPKPKTPLEKFLNESRMESVYDQLVYNSTVNLYRNDYRELLAGQDVQKVVEPEMQEFMSFADVDICEEKYVGSCCWHPMLSGIIAIAYVDAAACSLFQQKQAIDIVHRTVHGLNPVLVWSAVDSLNPQLEMEAPREVTSLQFCPFDENILIGGCRNGQVIIWDITNRLNLVDDSEVLTSAQQKYRTTMKRMTKWFKNTKNDALVRPACISDSNFSHHRSVTHIAWLPPQKRMTRTGLFEDVENPETDPSYQFMTSGEDGFFKIWDLKFIPPDAEDLRVAHYSKRLGKRLKELTVDVSPFAILNRILKPIFEINVSSDGKKSTPINHFILPEAVIDYVKVTNPEISTVDFKTRDKFRPVIGKMDSFPLIIHCTTVTGDVAMCMWKGFDYDPGADVNQEIATVTLYERFHDGLPFIIQSPFFSDVFLTIGGKIFIIWQKSLYQWGLNLQRCSYMINCATWSLQRPSLFFLGMTNGTVEVWDLISRGDKPIHNQSVSGKGLTAIIIHKIELPKPVLGLGDYRGTFRVFQIPEKFCEKSSNIYQSMAMQFQNTIDRKMDFDKWIQNWNSRNKELVERIVNDKLQAEIDKQANEEREQKRAEQMRQKKLEEEERRRIAESKPQPGKYKEWAQKRYDKMQARRMHNVLLEKKHLKREDLVHYLAPLNHIAEEKKNKAKKQEHLMQMKAKLLDDAIAVSFPETRTADDSLDAQSTSGISEMSRMDDQSIYDDLESFENFEEEMVKEVQAHKYELDFSWRYAISQGNERRKIIDYQLSVNVIHRARLVKEKKLSEEGESLTELAFQPPDEDPSE